MDELSTQFQLHVELAFDRGDTDTGERSVYRMEDLKL